MEKYCGYLHFDVQDSKCDENIYDILMFIQKLLNLSKYNTVTCLCKIVQICISCYCYLYFHAKVDTYV